MMALVFYGLGAFAVSLQGTTVTAFPTDKIRALFAYLALQSGQPHRREALAGLLWPEMEQSVALSNLRLALHRLRETLDKAQPGSSATLIQSTRQTIQLAPNLITVDVQTFQTLLAACAAHPHANLPQCSPCCARLAEAVELYRGELLTDFALLDAPAFEEWLLLRRETLHQQALAALHTLVQHYEQQGNDEQAHHYLVRQLALDPSREEAHRQLMRNLARRGLRTEALAQYESCRRLLREQLQVDPDPETMALVEQIWTGQFDKMIREQGDKATNEQVNARSSHPLPLSHPQDWGEAPEVGKVYGRQYELAELTQWLVQSRCRLIALLGIGGVGKTTLAAATVKAVAPHFDRTIWRSLVNAPPLDDLLGDILQRLADGHLLDIPTGFDAQLTLLLDYLRHRRILLVLDNWESILDPDQPGHARMGYGGYAQLLQTMSERGHQSCLLLTSRERPQGMARREEDSPLVRTLLLTGLDAAAGQAMLMARGLTGPVADVTGVVTRYSGNPLALKLVTQTIHDLFGGDMGAFLATEAPIFDDIRTVLDQQFARLSLLEQELLLWLAIDREPVTMQGLRDNLVQPGALRTLIEALRALQRRSLVHQSPQGFLLQNVITEYLTERLVESVCAEIYEFGTTNDELREATLDEQFVIRHSKLATSFLNRFALLKAIAKEPVRASQSRLLLQPVAVQLQARLGKVGLIARSQQILALLRTQGAVPGYAAGNLLNLLLQVGADLRGYNFAGLHVWQAHLQGVDLPGVNFAGANLTNALFSHSFGEILAIQFATNGQLLIASLIQGRLCLWRIQGTPTVGQLVQEAQSFGLGATLAHFSPDGRFLVSDHPDLCLRLWSVATGQLLYTLAGHTELPGAFAFTADATLLASSDGNGAVHLWDVATGVLRQTVQGAARSIPTLAFAPLTTQGQLLAAGNVDGGIYVWRVDDVAPLHYLSGHTEEVHALLFAADGTLLISGSHDRSIQVWEVTSGQLRYTLRTHTHPIRALAMSADGRTLASGGDDTFVGVWDLHSGQLRHRLLGLTYRINALSFSRSADGMRPMLATVSSDQSVGIWDTETGRRIHLLQAYSNHIYTLDLSPDGQVLVAGGTDTQVRLWDLAPVFTPSVSSPQRDSADLLVQTFTGHTQWIAGVAFAPVKGGVATAGHLLASGDRSGVIRLWDSGTGRTVQTFIGHRDDVEALTFSPDGQRLLSGGRDMTVRLWDVQRGGALATLAGHTDRLRACAFSPDGYTFASGSHDRTVRLWTADGADGRLLHTLTGHTNGVRAVAFSPDGQWLASSSYDHQVILWDVKRGQRFYTLPIQEVTVLALAFHPDGNLLAMGMNADTIRLWDLAQERIYAVLQGHTSGVEAVRFSPHGQWLVSGSWDETIRLWDVTTGTCLQTLRAPGPYAGMNIAGVTGISAAQKAALKALGAAEADQTTASQ